MALKPNPIFKSEAPAAPTLAEAVAAQEEQDIKEVKYQLASAPPLSDFDDDDDKADSVDVFVHTQGLPPKAATALEFMVSAQLDQSNGDHTAAVVCIDQAMGQLARWKIILQATALLLLSLSLSSCVTLLDNITGLSVTRDPASQSWTVGATVNPYPRVTK